MMLALILLPVTAAVVITFYLGGKFLRKRRKLEPNPWELQALQVLADIRRYRMLYTKHPRFGLIQHRITRILYPEDH